jgi:hypothetical protein
MQLSLSLNMSGPDVARTLYSLGEAVGACRMKDPHPPRYGSAIVWGAVAFVLISMILFFAPLVECPSCRITFAIEQGEQSTPSPRHFLFGRGCDFCWKGRMSVYTRWWDPHSPFPGSHYTEP